MEPTAISAADRYERRRVRALDSELAYVDVGARGFGGPSRHTGAPPARRRACESRGPHVQRPSVVFLHGNPTSSYLWRNVIPHVEPVARCLAPDLVGMGQSGKAPSGSYRFADHARYLDAWFDALALTRDVTLVMHDWGSALGFHWARRHPDRVSGLVYMEAIVRPVTWAEWPESARKIFQTMRSPAGEEIVLGKNVFVERILPASVMRPLGAEELEVYRAPYREPGESRRPTLQWPREIPLEGEPADVVAIVEAYGKWLAQSPIPKLFINAEPGSILVGAQRAFCRTWPKQDEVTVKGTHFIQEDSPREIGEAIRAFVAGRVLGAA